MQLFQLLPDVQGPGLPIFPGWFFISIESEAHQLSLPQAETLHQWSNLSVLIIYLSVLIQIFKMLD